MNRQERKRNPRSMAELKLLEQQARELYLSSGGADIDEALACLRLTMQAYSAQMQAHLELADVGMPHDPRRLVAWGPTVTPYEARMTAAKISTLVRQREQKMGECRKLLEEAAEHERLQAEAQAKAAEAQPVAAKPVETQPAAAPMPLEAPKVETRSAEKPAKRITRREELALAG